jgi:hypothetical protein
MRTVSASFCGKSRKNLQKLDASSSFNSGLDAMTPKCGENRDEETDKKDKESTG